MDFGKMKIPVIALAVGGTVKLILNILLISNPNINIYGATISSIACQGIALTICLVSLTRSMKLNINFKNNIFKPIIASAIMGMSAYIIYHVLHTIFIAHNLFESRVYLLNMIPTITAILIGIIVYGIAVILTKCLTKEEIYMIPFGTKLYKALVRIKLYE